MTPQRIQRRRHPGGRRPAGTISGGRPTRWGSRHLVTSDVDARTAVERYRADIYGGRLSVIDIRRELAGHDLACWCPLDAPCHADVLLDIANAVARHQRAALAARLRWEWDEERHHLDQLALIERGMA